MSTLDFELEIGLGTAETYPVVARAPGGEASAQLRLPVPLAELDHRLAVIRDAVLASSAVTRRLPTGDEHPVRRLGGRLFEALIADDVRGLYVASSHRAREHGGTLRLVLRVRPPELARLPWEFLFDPGRQDYLGLSLPLVRYPEVLAPRQPLHVEPPLHILGMSARPDDQGLLAVDSEQRRLHAALAKLQREAVVELGWVAGQTYGDLEAAMDRGSWHILHFVGHGGYDRALDEGILMLTDERGRTDRVGAEDLSRLLADHHTLRLVVLNACDTARGGSADAFSSTAAALMRRGIPAVVAMQFEISDDAAIRFAQTFYQNVAKRLPVDTAVMRARRALRRAKKDTLEWGTPVLYLRAADARIFDPPPSRPRRARTVRTGVRREPVTSPRPPLLLGRPEAVRTVRHDGAVNAVVFSPDGHRLATAGDDRTARVWDVTSGAQLVRLVHDTVVRAVAFSRNGRLVTATEGRTARVWSAPGPAFAAVGGRLATVAHNFLWGVALSPDGRRLATTSHDRTARIWDVGSGAQLLTLTHDNAVRGLVFSADGRRLATASDDCTARVWDVGSGAHLVTFTHDSAVRGVVFSADGRRLATASGVGTVRLWNVTDATLLATVTQDGEVRGLALSASGHWLATAGGDGTARVWDTGGAVLLTEVTHDDSVEGVAFSPCGRRLATASRDRTARIWVLEEEGDDE
ncbi:MAG: CHAT domain-containing WD40 repeat protein [Pseudonocardiaceae bacterium]